MKMNVVVVNKRLLKYGSGSTFLSLVINGREVERFNVEIFVATRITKAAEKKEKKLMLKNNNITLLTSERALSKTLQRYLAARGYSHRAVYAVFTSANSSSTITSYL